MRLFGFEIKRAKDQDPPVSFAPPTEDDGAVNISAGAGAYGAYLDLDGSIRTESELVTKYRMMEKNAEIDAAIEEICDETIVSEEGKQTVELIIDEEADIKESFIKKLQDEFKYIQKLLEFNTKPYDVFRAWYRDGRLYYHVIIDEKKPNDGIKELRYLDPRKIRKVRESVKKRDQKTAGQQITLIKGGKEYFVYSEHGFFRNNRVNAPTSTSVTGIKIAKDSILHCTSGVSDTGSRMILSHP